ncbi:hypothetical protein [Streptomyces sp. NPDC002851]
MRRTLAAVCAVVVLGGAGGCGTAESRSASDGPDTGRTRLADLTELTELTDAQQATVDRAQERLIKQCMAGRGFWYGEARQLTGDELKTPGYVLDDPRWARKHGYGGRIQRAMDRERHADPNVAYYRKLSRERQLRWSDALYGGPGAGTVEARLPGGGTVSTATEGCNAEALRELYGDLKTWFPAEKTAAGLRALYEPRIKRDKRFVAAVHSWARCMRDKGHRYRGPAALRDQLPTLTRGLSDGRAHAVEVGLAVDEAACARSSGLARTARDLEDRFRGELAEGRYREQVGTHLRLQHRALAKAEDVLGTSA